jgi:hypothetical protein
VWLVSVLPLAMPGAGHWLSGLSRTGVCLLPWLVFAGWPESAPAHERRAERAGAGGAWSLVALALPPTALALRIDASAGLDVGAVSVLAALSLACALLLRTSAAACAGDARRGVRYSVAWLVLVPGLPFLCAALERGGAPAYGQAAAGLSFLARASPLGWLARTLAEIGPEASRSPAGAGPVLTSALWPACATLALSVLAHRGRSAAAGWEASS